MNTLTFDINTPTFDTPEFHMEPVLLVHIAFLLIRGFFQISQLHFRCSKIKKRNIKLIDYFGVLKIAKKLVYIQGYDNE